MFVTDNSPDTKAIRKIDMVIQYSNLSDLNYYDNAIEWLRWFDSMYVKR